MQFRGDSSSASPSLSILIVDSDAETAATTRAAVSRDGHFCRVIATAAEALALLGHERFDIIIVEAELADGPGVSVLRELERRPLEFMLAAVLGHADHDANRIEAIEVISRGDPNATSWLAEALMRLDAKARHGKA